MKPASQVEEISGIGHGVRGNNDASWWGKDDFILWHARHVAWIQRRSRFLAPYRQGATYCQQALPRPQVAWHLSGTGLLCPGKLRFCFKHTGQTPESCNVLLPTLIFSWMISDRRKVYQDQVLWTLQRQGFPHKSVPGAPELNLRGTFE